MPGTALVGDIIGRVGFDDARALWALAQQGADYVRAAAAAMPDVPLSEGVLEVSNVDAGDQVIALLQTLGEDFGTEVEGWQAERVRAVLRTERYFHAIHFPKAFQIDGRKYVRGLAALAEQAGVRIFEETPVVGIDPAGIRKRVVTPSAKLRCSHIVLAGSVHLGAPGRRLATTLLPVWRYAALTEPIGERLAETVAFAAPSLTPTASTTSAWSAAIACCGRARRPRGRRAAPFRAQHPRRITTCFPRWGRSRLRGAGAGRSA